MFSVSVAQMKCEKMLVSVSKNIFSMNSLAASAFFGGPKGIICKVKMYISAVNSNHKYISAVKNNHNKNTQYTITGPHDPIITIV